MLAEDFYAYFNISPITLLSECQYDNEFKRGICYGDDVCDHVEEPDFDCKNCEKSETKFPYYPPLDDEVIINLILICGIDGLKLKSYHDAKDKQVILSYVIEKSKDTNIYKLIFEYLKDWVVNNA